MVILNPSDLRRIFAKLDRDNDGRLSTEELSWILDRVGAATPPDELERIVGLKSLDLVEFIFFYESITAARDGGDAIDEDRDLVEAFKVFDQNGDGFISSEELESVLSSLGMREEINGRDCKKMICAFDRDSNGLLDFEEFKRMMLLG